MTTRRIFVTQIAHASAQQKTSSNVSPIQFTITKHLFNTDARLQTLVQQKMWILSGHQIKLT